MQFNPYLNFKGNCREAFELYAKVFGGKIEGMTTHGDSPAADQMPVELHDQITHARLVVGDAILLASDSPPEYYEEPKGLWVTVNIEDEAEADRIFAALAENGKVTMQIDKTFWAKRFGMVVDRFGIPWMINCV